MATVTVAKKTATAVAKRKIRTPATAKRKIRIKRSDGSWCEVTIPASAKMTFGPLFPGKQTPYGKPNAGEGGHYLRIYEGTTNNQRAVIENVVEFYDCSYDYKDVTQGLNANKDGF